MIRYVKIDKSDPPPVDDDRAASRYQYEWWFDWCRDKNPETYWDRRIRRVRQGKRRPASPRPLYREAKKKSLTLRTLFRKLMKG